MNSGYSDSYPLPTSLQISATQATIDHYLQPINRDPNSRIDTVPYYQFHDITPRSKKIWGTVLIFHDFSATPRQTRPLADYLYAHGFNIYQASIAGHAVLPPDKFWPQISFKPKLYDLLRQQVENDPIFQNYRQALITNSEYVAMLTRAQRSALLERLLTLEPRLQEVISALNSDTLPQTTPYFDSTTATYLEHAQDRLTDLAELPSPIYVIGIGLGATLGLLLAADRPHRIKRVVAYAPFLQLWREFYQYWLMADVFNIREPGWQQQISCPARTWAPLAELSQTLSMAKVQKNLRKVPIFWVSTENDEVNDPEADSQFMQQLGGTWKGNYHYLYPRHALVPRAVITPPSDSLGMSNYFWRSLYQETWRFLVTGEVDQRHLGQWQLDSRLPSLGDDH